MRPVTQSAEVLVKRASTKDRGPFRENGIKRRNAPIKAMKIYPKITIIAARRSIYLRIARFEFFKYPL